MDISIKNTKFVGQEEKYGRNFKRYSMELSVGSESATVDVYIDISGETSNKADYILIENDPFVNY